MRIPKALIRRLMVVVGGFALSLGLAIPAAEVHRTKESHPHGYIGRGSLSGPRAARDDVVFATFWPRYWRRMMGQSWEKSPICPANPARLEEVCSIEQPETFATTCLSSNRYFSASIEMRRTVRKLTGLVPDPRLESVVRHP